MKDWGADQWGTQYKLYIGRPNPEKTIDPLFLHFMKICAEEKMLGRKYFYLWWWGWSSYVGVPDFYGSPEKCAGLDTDPKFKGGREDIVTELRMLLREFKERGWPEPLFGPMDEATMNDVPTLQALHNIMSPLGAKLSTQTPDNSTDLKWLKVIDIPLSYNNWFFRTQCQALHKLGIPNQFWRAIWGHEQIQSLNRAEPGLLALYCGVDAFQYFWYIPELNPESDLDNVGAWGSPTEMTAGYLRDFGVISGLHAEVMRTARDDARYALAVRHLIQEGKKDPARKALAEKTETELNAMLNTLANPNEPVGFEASKIDWDGLRQNLKNWAVALSGQAVLGAKTAPGLPFSRSLNPPAVK